MGCGMDGPAQPGNDLPLQSDLAVGEGSGLPRTTSPTVPGAYRSKRHSFPGIKSRNKCNTVLCCFLSFVLEAGLLGPSVLRWPRPDVSRIAQWSTHLCRAHAGISQAAGPTGLFSY